MSVKTLHSPLGAVAAAKGDALRTARPDDLVSASIKRMYDEDIGALAVVDDGRLVGIFTERDALYRVVNAGRDPAATPLSEVMTRDPEAASPSLTVIDALRLVTEQRFRHLPLIERGELVAMVSSGDLTRWLVKTHDAEIARLNRSLRGLASRNKALLALIAGLLALIVIGIATD